MTTNVGLLSSPKPVAPGTANCSNSVTPSIDAGSAFAPSVVWNWSLPVASSAPRGMASSGGPPTSAPRTAGS